MGNGISEVDPERLYGEINERRGLDRDSRRESAVPLGRRRCPRLPAPMK